MRISAPVPGTPAMAQSPSTRALPFFTGTFDTSIVPVLVLWMRTVVDRLGGFDQALVDREGRHCRRDVPAVGVVADDVALHIDLREGVVDIGIGALGTLDDRHLRGHQAGAAEPVDLQHVGRAHGALEQAVACRAGRRQVRLVEEQRLAGAAAHQHAAHFVLFHDGVGGHRVRLLQ